MVKFSRIWSVFLAFLIFSQPTNSLANPSPFSEVEKSLERLQVTIQENRLTLPTLNRPENCTLDSPTFGEIADQLENISHALANSKCYEEHKQEIDMINRAGRTMRSDLTFDLPAYEDGSFMETRSNTQINITNNQTVSVTNENSLISGLFKISKDKTCRESLAKTSNLGNIASMLTRLGTVGLVLPSAIGVVGSTTLITAGWSLYILDKIVNRKTFKWDLREDRRDFMAMVCSVYHMRTRLLKAEFSAVRPENSRELIQISEKTLNSLKDLSFQLEEIDLNWNKQYQAKLSAYLAGQFPQKNHQLFELLNEGIRKLTSNEAYGEKPQDREVVYSYFLGKRSQYSELFNHSEINPDYREKALAQLNSLLDPGLAAVYQLNRRDWRMGKMRALAFLFQQILETNFSKYPVAIREFQAQSDPESKTSRGDLQKQMRLEKARISAAIAELQSNLTTKIANLQRLETQDLLSTHDEGARSEYDILREFQNIRKVLLGSKGWSFVSFLIESAQEQINLFEANYKNWKPRAMDKANRVWNCRNAAQTLAYWQTANAAVEHTYDYFSANSDIWSDHTKKFDWFLKFIPIGFDPEYKLVKAVKSAEEAKKYLKEGRSHADLEASTANINLGSVIIKVQRQAINRDELARYIDENNCGAIKEF